MKNNTLIVFWLSKITFQEAIFTDKFKFGNVT